MSTILKQMSLEEIHADNARMFEIACQKAERESRDDGCTKHVNATLGVINKNPVFLRFYTSDWYDSDATLCTFTNGDMQS